MPLPMAVLIAAAAKIAQDERTHKAAKALFVAGSDMLERRRAAAKAAPEAPAEPAKGPKWRAGIDRRVKFRPGASGDLIRFRYTDEHGLVTDRIVGNWTCDGKNLTGLCLNKKAVCEFAIGAITDWADVPVPAVGR